MSKKSEWVYDELLCFLGSPFFQVPVCGFIENNCLIFDPTIEGDVEEHKILHQEYKKGVEKLLHAFTVDSKLSHDEVIKALNEMGSKKDIKEMFHGLFEQVLAMDELEVFVRLMTQKNIELQQQALMLILKTQGSLPDSLTDGGETKPQPAQPAQPAQTAQPSGQMDDDEIMRRVLEESKREYEEEQKRLKKEEKKDKKMLEKTLAASQHEIQHLEHQKQAEKEKMTAVMANLKISDMPPLTQEPPKVIPPQKPVEAKKEKPIIKISGEKEETPGAGVSLTSIGAGLQAAPKLPGISSSQAASDWLKSAQAESSSQSQNDAVQKAAAAMAGMTPEEIQKRQKFLIEQRDKLIAMKKKEREKQLLSAEQSNPRPSSSRAARTSLQSGQEKEETPQLSAEEQKKIEMRKTIANKLKAELMGGK